MDSSLSVVTPCFNDFANLTATLQSIREELRRGDELLIVDSSDDRERVEELVRESGIICNVRYRWMPASGVFAAQNAGIIQSRTDWIQILNSGDRLCVGARAEIDRKVRENPDTQMHVFRQAAIGPIGVSYVYTPTSASVWPHQSIIVHRSVYIQEGLYPKGYRFQADQLYFAKVRHAHKWKIHPEVLTEYLLGGLSAGVNWVHLNEIYTVRRALGQGVLKSGLGAYVLPPGRRLLELLLGQKMATKIKTCFTSHYHLTAHVK